MVLNKHNQILEEGEEYDAVAAQVESEALAENQIAVPEELIDPHPLVLKTAKSLRGAGENDYGLVSPGRNAVWTCALESKALIAPPGFWMHSSGPWRSVTSPWCLMRRRCN